MSNVPHPPPHAWYVVYCLPLKEHQAAAALEGYLGLVVYLPEIQQRIRGREQRAPLFPRYLFVGADLRTVGVSRITSVPGVLRLVAFGERPEEVPAEVIDALRVQVERYNHAEASAEYDFQPGDTVRVKHGPLHGLEGIFEGSARPSSRARILIRFLGRLSNVEVDIGNLEGQPKATPPKRARRTRGKGRRIGRKQPTQLDSGV